jgi:ATP/maltotriose-dependent transcriptional regulator MalT
MEERSAVVLPLLDGCTFLSNQGDRHAAGRWLTSLQDIAQQTGNPVASAAVDEAAGAVALAEGERERATRAFESAVEAWKAVSRPYDVARCQMKLAEALLSIPTSRAGSRSEAAELLAIAEATFAELGATADQRTAGDLLRKSGVLSPARRRRTTPARRETVGGLTLRERDVLELLVAGHSNREIASALFIAESTAELHVSRVLGKLGCATRAQAAVRAVSQGWCPQPVPERATA